MGGERLDTRNPTSKLMLTILAGVATWEREIMLERQREGIAKAKGEGKYKGRPASIDAFEVKRVPAWSVRRRPPSNSVSPAAPSIGCSIKPPSAHSTDRQVDAIDALRPRCSVDVALLRHGVAWLSNLDRGRGAWLSRGGRPGSTRRFRPREDKQRTPE